MPDTAAPTRRTTKKPMPPVDPAEFFLHVYGAMSGQMGPGVFADSHIRAIGNPRNAEKLYRSYHKSVSEANEAIADGSMFGD